MNIFGWQSGDREFHMPPGIGFRVGGSTGLKDLVLTKHFWHQDKCPEGEDSGYELEIIAAKDAPDYKSAGQLCIETGGRIPAKSISSVEMAIQIEDPGPLHAFAHFTHTHMMGTSVSVWKVNNQTNEWIHWATFDPIANRHHQFFDPSKDLTLNQGDVIAVRCTYNNTLDREARLGDKLGYEEMCKFFLAYVDQGSAMLSLSGIHTPGPPEYDWDKDEYIAFVPDYVREN